MTQSRTVGVLIVGAGLIAACTSSKGDGRSSSGPPTGSTSSGTAQCTEASAETARSSLITSAGFNPSCVKIKAKAKFFFVDNEKKHHTATTRPSSPAQFDADLRTKGSTYVQTFRKTGTYVIYDKVTQKSMTLFVTA